MRTIFFALQSHAPDDTRSQALLRSVELDEHRAAAGRMQHMVGMHHDVTVFMLTHSHIIMRFSEGDETEVVLVAESMKEADEWIQAILAKPSGDVAKGPGKT
jgi:hypothetical protein